MSRPVAVVTGASKGIGRAVALRLCEDYEIVAIARSESELNELAKEIEGRGGRCRPLALDLTTLAADRSPLAGVDAHVLVNNAGVGVMKPFAEMTREEWTSMVDVNFNALYDVTHALLPAMMRRKSGHIVNIGSITGRTAFPGGACYAATKAAVQSFSESLMLELRDYNIKVSVVAPGSVNTNFSGWGREPGDWKLSPADVAEAVASVIDTPPAVLIHRVEVRTLTVPKKK